MRPAFVRFWFGCSRAILLVTPCMLTRMREFIHIQHRNSPNSQISEYTCSISYNVPFRRETLQISILNGALWVMAQVHCGICEIGLIPNWESLLLRCLGLKSFSSFKSPTALWILARNHLINTMFRDGIAASGSGRCDCITQLFTNQGREWAPEREKKQNIDIDIN